MGEGVKKEFKRGSYTIITPPLKVQFDVMKQDLVVHYN